MKDPTQKRFIGTREQNTLNVLEIKKRQSEVFVWKNEEENKELPKY